MLSPELSSDRPIETLPLWLLRHIVRPENHRLVGKKPKFYSEYGTTGYYSRGASHYNPSRTFTPAPLYPVRVWDHEAERWVDKPREETKLDLVAHLNSNDYRLWAEVRTKSVYQITTHMVMVRCRWCNERFHIREFKQIKLTHKERCNFTHNLREVYNNLLQMGQCTVCNCHTTNRRWGIPLCNVECERAWMFQEYNSERLSLAIIQARLDKRIRENERGNVRAIRETSPD